MRLTMACCFLLVSFLFVGCRSDDEQSSTAAEEASQESSQTAALVVEPATANADEDSATDTAASAVTDTTLLNTNLKNNDAAYIPAQCYTKTTADNGEVHNPCFACHTNSDVPNYINDLDFQMVADFRPTTVTNKWSNLFKDRTDEVAAMSDTAIQAWVRKSNYFADDGGLLLANKLAEVPANWDFNGDGQWDGYVPDLYFNFDDQGFDKTPNGDDSGWRAFAYTPFLGTFWPTNGSTDDVLIRLPAAMREDNDGHYSRTVYQLNLAIVEAVVTKSDVVIAVTDESLYDVDLNANGRIDQADKIVYAWQPSAGRFMSYVGRAKALQVAGELHMAGGLYPEGTEFIHTVRYIDVSNEGEISLAPRMKELRYSRKHSWNTYGQLNNAALTEIREGDQWPERLRNIKGNPEIGVVNGQGWLYQGFIEDQQGELRPQSYEESVNCVGCHSGIGVTADSSFAFPRKLAHDQFQGGWFHWSQKGLTGIPEPQWRDGTWEYTEYLRQNRSGNEFRNNSEVTSRFFTGSGELNAEAIEQLHSDIATLILPSAERAWQLNKAYKVIVDEQSFIYGRDAHIEPLDNVWQEAPAGEVTGVVEPVVRAW
ncbi:hypothetical protein [Halioxenophilus sp. WMMB6]|uniref:hypothetical protein n=1 Tax=Halioxenophilus sp. WMMB6 TaxID=3073815 RepID=UPI00295ECDB3|nr:hypothetical protein [Halioxenophilus sp. WMMB6]